MRKAQVKQAIELVSQIEEAHSQIKKYIEQKNNQPAMELLCDCQNGAIAIGTLIESTEGEGHCAVALLEQYCELAYRLYEDLRENREVSANKIYKLLKQETVRISNNIKHEIQIRTEAVFLPYKASMWDSLESVWRAADADKNCDAYVIPIPYYDKNPDGSFREMHYEADQFPDDVPVTKYDEFDFETHRPDMIFIHNPYDNMNYVTSVHPFFYSDHLKQFTEKLVYIPYFVLGEISPENEPEIEEMKHFCTVPGVLHADKVIVQSEDMKQVYLKVLLAAMNDCSDAANNYWDGKILGLGSPKFDRIVQTRQEDIEIPQAWEKIIERPDKSRKRIILYNTTINGLLGHNEIMLKKIESVLEKLKENRDDVVLLWRPHPLIESTLTSMRPQLWDAYREIRDKYIREGWGIYDDSADLDRAVLLSDAYYGDYSSVVQVYKKTGKPVMLQDCSINYLNDEKMQYVRMIKSYLYEDKLIFASTDYNALFSADITSGEILYLGRFSGEKTEQSNLFSQVVQFETSIAVCPCLASSAYIYDCQKKEIRELCIAGLRNHSYQIFPVLEQGEEVLYTIPTFGAVFGQLNREMSGFVFKVNFQEEYEKRTGKKYKVGSDSGLYVYNGCLYFAVCEDSFLVKFHMQSHQMTFLKIAEADGGFYKILGAGHILYAMNVKNKIISYDLEKERVVSVLDFCTRESESSLFRDGFFWGESIYFVSYQSNQCVKYIPKSRELTVSTIESEWNIETEDREVYHFTCLAGKKTIFFVSNKNHLVRLNENDQRRHTITLRYDEEELKKQITKEMEKDRESVILENEFTGDLQALLHYIKKHDEKRKLFKSGQMIGQRVYEQVIR